MYAIISRDFEKNQITKIKETNNLSEAYDICEGFALSFIEMKIGIGDEKIRKILNPSKSGNYGKHPFGFFIEKGKGLSSLIVMEKKLIRGYLYNQTKINKIVSFELCVLSKFPQKNYEERQEWEDIDIIDENIKKKIEIFSDTRELIKNYFSTEIQEESAEVVRLTADLKKREFKLIHEEILRKTAPLAKPEI